MRPAMTEAEIALLENLFAHATNMFEFGAGGSTCTASRLVRGSVTTLDSSLEWLMRVREACERQRTKIPVTRFADIGPVRELGYPSDDQYRDRWPSYPRAVLDAPDRDDIDTFLVDGRFRVACFAAAMTVARRDAVVLVHDYVHRPVYAAMETIARPVIVVDTLAVFVRTAGADNGTIARLLDEYAHEPA